jgi:hypothetical protein
VVQKGAETHSEPGDLLTTDTHCWFVPGMTPTEGSRNSVVGPCRKKEWYCGWVLWVSWVCGQLPGFKLRRKTRLICDEISAPLIQCSHSRL